MHGPAGGCACGRPARKSNAGELDGRLDGAVVGLFGAAFALPVFTMQKLVRKRTAGLAEEVPVEPHDVLVFVRRAQLHRGVGAVDGVLPAVERTAPDDAAHRSATAHAAAGTGHDLDEVVG